MPNDGFSYQLVGGTPVIVESLEITAPGTTTASPGHAYNPVVCDISGSLEEKSLTVTANNDYTITPSAGKSGMSKVLLTVNVPNPSTGTLDITSNGEHDVTNYAAANVAIAAYANALTAPYAANDGKYFLVAVDAESNSVAAVCTVASGSVSDSYGDGTFAIADEVLSWTPSITAESVMCWYVAAVVE